MRRFFRPVPLSAFLAAVLFATAGAVAQTAAPSAHPDAPPVAAPGPEASPAAPPPETVPAAPPPAETEAMYSFGNANPDCLEWTDACQVCLRDQDGVQQCSTPGIACRPTPAVCRVTKRVRPVEPPAELPSSTGAPAPSPTGK